MSCVPCPAMLRVVRDPLPQQAQEAVPPQFCSPDDAAKIVTPLLRAEPSEVMLALLLNTEHRLIGVTVVGRGGIDHVPAEPREVFRTAILANAATVLLAHNHPSGDPEPSQPDLDVTRRLAAAGRLLGIPLLDHLVIGDSGRYVSIRDREPNRFDE